MQSYNQLKQYDKALECVNKSLQIDPNYNHAKDQKVTAEKKIEEEMVIKQKAIEKILQKEAMEKVKKELEFKLAQEEKESLGNALKINEEGLKLYESGQNLEASKKFSLAIRKYKDAAIKFKEAISIKVVDSIFHSFVKVIDSFISVKAYDQAKESIKEAKIHFFDKKEEYFKLVDDLLATGQNWSQDYGNLYKVQLSKELAGDNIIEHSEGY